MKRAIIITGTPGTGKTTVARELAKRAGLTYVDVNEVIKEHGLSDGFDDERMCDIVDTERLVKVFVSLIEGSGKTLMIDSHMSHFLPREHVKLCLIAKCSLGELKKRLQKRGYSEEKVRENLDADIFDVCLMEAESAGHDVIIVDTDKEIDYDMLLKKVLNSI